MNRFHATRPITFADALRRRSEVDSSGQSLGLLKVLCGSAVWLAAGVTVRPDRLQRGPLAQRLATLQEKSHWWSRS